MPPTKGSGIIDMPSNHSLDQTVERLKGILEAKGVILYALVDHSGEAEKLGMIMRPTKLQIFGNPKGGTPVMLTAPSIAIDLPLKILVWEDGKGQAWLSYNSPTFTGAAQLAVGFAAKYLCCISIGSQRRCLVYAMSHPRAEMGAD